MAADEERTLPLTIEIVAAYVRNNQIPATDLPALVQKVSGALVDIKRSKGAKGETSRSAEVTRRPAVPIRRSVMPDFIICLEDGKKLKSLKRHLMAKHGLTPQEYRTKWGLPPDYPMVAPNYAAKRSEIGKQARRRQLGYISEPK